MIASAEPHLDDKSPQLPNRSRHVERTCTIWLPPAKWWYFICVLRSDAEIVGLSHVVRPFRGSRLLIALSTYSLHAYYVSSQCVKELNSFPRHCFTLPLANRQQVTTLQSSVLISFRHISKFIRNRSSYPVTTNTHNVSKFTALDIVFL